MCLDTSSLKKPLTYLEAKYYLTEAYDDKFGIDSGPTHCEMGEIEKISEYSLYRHRLREFIRLGIGDKLKISFNEYLQYTRAEINIVKKEVDLQAAEETKKGNDLVNKLGASSPERG